MEPGHEDRATFLVIDAGGHRCGLPIDRVDQVHPVVRIDDLPGAPDLVEGVVDVHGELVAVIDMAARFGEPRRGVRLDDHLVLVRTPRRRLALHVGPSVDLVEAPATVAVDASARDEHWVAGAVASPLGIVVVHDLEALLSATDDEVLEVALDAARAAAAAS